MEVEVGVQQYGADSEVGRLHTVVLHRPGPEIKRLTPRNSADLLFDAIPWVERAQEEHDAFAATLAEEGVEVLGLRNLVAEALEVGAARDELLEQTLADRRLGNELRRALASHLEALSAAELTDTLIAGLSYGELGAGKGVVARLLAPNEFVVPPLPNLMFTRDSSVWLGDQVAVTSLSMPARRREAWLTEVVYRHHPRFASTSLVYEPADEWLEGGDVLLLAPGVVAVGVGQRTRPEAVETLAGRLFARGLAHTVLAVPIAQERATMHLDTICTMVDVDAVVMYPALADSLTAIVVTPAGDDAQVASEPQPFLEAAAAAMGIDELRVIDTGLDPVTAEREQWDDGNNTLAIAPRVAVAYERNVVTNARLEAAGIEVLRIPGSELGSGRGGPRCMSCPVSRDSLTG
ncbi:MAG TPA: arginine deiminase [Mycobacteriales bacterium]|nr:arginine deiminase [Mycobacteriales bacterium]